jgi:hypothetical protein
VSLSIRPKIPVRPFYLFNVQHLCIPNAGYLTPRSLSLPLSLALPLLITNSTVSKHNQPMASAKTIKNKPKPPASRQKFRKAEAGLPTNRQKRLGVEQPRHKDTSRLSPSWILGYLATWDRQKNSWHAKRPFPRWVKNQINKTQARGSTENATLANFT